MSGTAAAMPEAAGPPIPSRRLPAASRTAVRAGAVFAAIGIVVTSYVFLVLWHVQDRRPAQLIEAPWVGQQFTTLDVFDKPEAHFTITAAHRQNSRAAGGDRADIDFIDLRLSYVAITEHYPDTTAWSITAPGTEESSGNMYLQAFGRLTAGQETTGTVTFSGVPTGQSATIVYEGPFDDEPILTIVVPPLLP